MNLILGFRKDGRLELRPSRLFRGMLALVALIMCTAIAVNLKESATPAVMPVLFALAAGFASLYEERWIFSSDSIESRHGLIFPYSRRVLRLETIEQFSLNSFTKGKLKGTNPEGPSFLPSYIVLAAETHDGDRLTLEILRYGKRERLEAKATKIAAYCSKPLVNEIL